MSLDAKNDDLEQRESGNEPPLDILPEAYLSQMRLFWSHLDPVRLKKAFEEGFSRRSDPAFDDLHYYFEHYARPQKFAAQIARVICGEPAFTRNNLGPIDSFLGPKKLKLSPSEQLDELKPLVIMVNRALAAAQLSNPTSQPPDADNSLLAANYRNILKSLGLAPPAPPAPPAFFLKQQLAALRRKANTSQVDDTTLFDRIARLEDSIQAMVLAKKFFGKHGPLVIIPDGYGDADRLSFLEDQLKYFQEILNRYHQVLIKKRLQYSATLDEEETEEKGVIPGTPETLSASSTSTPGASPVLMIQSATAGLSTPPPLSEKSQRITEKYEELLKKLMDVASRITSLQGTMDNPRSGELIASRELAELAAGRALEAQITLENVGEEIFKHRRLWHEISENSRAASLIKKCLQLLTAAQKRITEIETENITAEISWPEIPYSANRASMQRVDNVQNMSVELEQIIINLEADHMELKEQHYGAEALKSEKEAELRDRKDRLDRLIKELTALSGQKNTLIAVYELIHKGLALSQ